VTATDTAQFESVSTLPETGRLGVERETQSAVVTRLSDSRTTWLRDDSPVYREIPQALWYNHRSNRRRRKRVHRRRPWWRAIPCGVRWRWATGLRLARHPTSHRV